MVKYVKVMWSLKGPSGPDCSPNMKIMEQISHRLSFAMFLCAVSGC